MSSCCLNTLLGGARQAWQNHMMSKREMSRVLGVAVDGDTGREEV